MTGQFIFGQNTVDSVYFMVDTTSKHVNYVVKKTGKNVLKIKSNYYKHDIKAMGQDYVTLYVQTEKQLNKNELRETPFITENWIYKQTDKHTLKARVPSVTINSYLIFKNDWQNKSDSISIYECRSFVYDNKPVLKDTVVCVVDTSYIHTSFLKISSDDWKVKVTCNYYNDSIFDKDDANVWFEKNSEKFIISKYRIDNGYYIMHTDRWIHRQTNLSIIESRIGYWNSKNIKYVVFKHDINDGNNNVTMYKVNYDYSFVLE